MIRARWLILAGGLILALAARAGAQASAEAMVDKAIQAHGGAAALERARVVVRTSSGTITVNAMDTPFTSELTTDLPDRYRLSVQLGPQKTALLTVINGKKGWHVNGGMTLEMSPDGVAEAREEGYVLHASSLVPLRNDKGCTLKVMPEEKHQGKAVTVVKASVKGRDDILFSFDKETNLLMKMSRKTAFGGLTADKEYVFDNYKEFNGAKLPTRMQELLNGRKYMDSTIGSYRFLQKADDRDFAKP